MGNTSLIGIISDTHDNRASIRKAVEVFNTHGCSLVIHAGDYVAPFTVREFGKLNCPLIGVFGNNDGEIKGLKEHFSKIGSLFEAPYQFTHCNRKFAVMHEPFYLDKYIVQNDVDVVIYGHTHEIDVRHEEPMVINPGECCSWLTGRSTVVLLDCTTLEEKVIDLED